MPGRFLNAFKPVARLMPEVKLPDRKVGFGEKLFWTGLVLVIYLIMSEIPLYGITLARGVDPFYYMRVIFASSRGTLMELGIGPIVTAGLILQLLAGSGMINVDFSSADDRALFTSATKFASIIMTVVQASAYLIGGAYGRITPESSVLIFLQLIFVGIIVMLLDELVQKGWGIGSGISLFIIAGVAQRIWWDCFAPIPMSKDGKYLGAIIAFVQGILNRESWWNIVHRPANLPDMIGFLVTIAVFVTVIYVEGVRIELPIAYARFKGFRGRYPVKLLYVSNVPVILASTVFANIYLFSQIFWSNFNRDNQNVWLNMFGMYNATSPTPEPIGGLAYYAVPPRGLDAVFGDPIRALVYAGLMITLCAMFAMIWIDIGGLGPRTVAKQLLDAGMQIPGFRRSYRSIQEILERYIPTVTILGGITVGAIAAFADFFGVFGTGMGALLAVGILYQYYQLMVQERVTEMYPALRRFMGGR